MSRIALIFLLLLLSFVVAAAQPNAPASSSPSKPWASHCHLDGMTFSYPEDRTFRAALAQRCNAMDACLLSCMRSGCAEGVGGGCFHMCSSGADSDSDLLERAQKYKDRTAYLCRRPPNNSFKPKPLRSTKHMAGKACHVFGSTARFGLT